MLIASVGADFEDEFVRLRDELGFRELDDLRFDVALGLVLV
ncbi:MAG TPA: hypothetical protein VFM94_07180 [Solirubrobacterales bacterium]|nr:hypothetical protein [Solirubrobacterales bacterium]